MKYNTSRFPLVKLPPSIDVALYLIREELKSQKFFHALSKAGIDDIYYQPHLGRAILMNLGMDDGRDETFQFYYRVIEKRRKKIGMDNESIVKQAFKVYNELISEKGRRKGLQKGGRLV
jgi:hypothetical protein